MRKFLAITAMFATASSASSADLSIADMLGRWCQVAPDNSTNIFSPNDLTVLFPDGQKRVLRIAEIRPRGQQIQIWWLGLSDEYNGTWYEMSDDRRTLIQLPNTAGDKGPRREFKRC